jgi:hypothetical protein
MTFRRYAEEKESQNSSKLTKFMKITIFYVPINLQQLKPSKQIFFLVSRTKGRNKKIFFVYKHHKMAVWQSQSFQKVINHMNVDCEGILVVNYWEKSHQWCPSKWVIGLSIKCVSYGV